MALSTCDVKTDQCGREVAYHGDVGFPIACYDENFSIHLVPWHWHDDFEFIIIREGTAHIYVENQRILVKQGDAVLVNSGILHCVNGGVADAALCHSLVFHPRLLGSIDSIFWQKLIFPFLNNKSFSVQFFSQTVPWQKEIIEKMESAWNLIANEPSDYENEVRYLLSKCFYVLNDMLSSSIRAVTSQERIAATRTQAMMQYIHDHFSEDITLEQIANSLSASKSMCLRCFKQTIGITPVRYLVEYRIEKASEMLITTDLKVSQIAIACGFSDISYFTKAFREHMGCAPLEYRKQH